MDEVNILIIGGGIVGCAIAAELSKQWQDVFVVECFPRVGMATSTRNSGVIHSGIYYSPGSLKACHCLQGNSLTFDFCEKHNVPHRRTGKLVVAAETHEQPALEALYKRGQENGVEGLRLIGPAEIHAREPHIAGVAALDVASTGIVSAEELVRTYVRVAVEQSAHIVTRAQVVSLEPTANAIRVGIRVGDVSTQTKTSRTQVAREHASTAARQDEIATQETIEARCVINAAGLYADDVAALIGNNSWKIYPVRGEYCEVRGPRRSLINGLVYPLPHADGLTLGMHFTKTIWDTVLIGPTARYVKDKDDYERDRFTVADFADGAKLLVPEIAADDLQLAYSGLRPKLVPPNQHGMADFVIERDAKVPQMIHLVGMESPGLTAAPSVARQVAGMVSEILD
ncbi:MAG TPA: NAD(P)/FAD-dependent oxidoreductase [Candidatus Acidoferrales bacterium]|jgi:glycerol-3-phosphate dehydrogenase|nr:NAD(P)/FAD-dependent oxidoreductase [Candidatus Acidoferrales bacterium]